MARSALRTIAADTRALGPSAPVRAAYEASKRSGFHAVLFRGKVRRYHPAVPVHLTGLLPHGEAARQRCLDDAGSVLGQGLRAFGQRVRTGGSAPWSTDPLTGRQWPELEPWWRIDIRSDARLSDVKHTWEVARHRDLVVLARAAHLDPTGPWLDGLTGLLRSWCEQSPPERGVNWYSSLELALRAIAWSQILVLAGERLPRELVVTMERLLLASARHLTVELPYTMSSMRNNHMLGDALGLIVLSRMFPTVRRARWWGLAGERMFAAQLRRHVAADGRMIEDSLSYHRFVLEMLIVRVLLGEAPAGVRHDLHAASRHLIRLGVFDGEIPQYGDWDEGRVLASSGDPLDVAGSVALGLVLCGDRVPTRWYADFDELAWYAPEPPEAGDLAPTVRTPAVTASGGIARVKRGPWRVWFKVDAGPSHGHADLTSVWIRHGDRWLVADPGTGTYNGPLEVRNGLRTSAAHPVRRPDGRDQLVPHRAFRWLNSGRGHLGEPLILPGQTVLFGWHDAYARGERPVRVGRAVVVADRYVAVVEFADRSTAVGSWSLTVPLHPDVLLDGDTMTVGESKVGLFGLAGHSTVRGRSTPFAGWYSRTYGRWEPATWITAESRAATTVWGLGTAPGLRGGPDDLDGLRFAVTWSRTGACLAVTHTDSGQVHHVRAPR
ncbi:heparinase II/III domain-containing protein [Micromonospora siamensis]|uniref:Heparinase II/III N-terminus n=1 Tax=Micromonospora siamensis TaxID=299152 RepID=A0A1C5HZG3_9ACTN|nr:heparinase II/III family protein [Micromonospora siamensis]SCG51359.1 Heparinase II/III N-terminus [Micromonospora siamensis]